MYLYLYDALVGDKKHEKTIVRIEHRLTDLGINGRIARSTILTNPKIIVRDAIRRGVKTVVAVGGDSLIHSIITSLVGTDAALGIIPLGDNQSLANILGIPKNEAACDVLSARKIEYIDLGKINNTYFLTSASVLSDAIKITCDGNFTVQPVKKKSQTSVYNFREMPDDTPPAYLHFFNPQDGILEATIEPLGFSLTNNILKTFGKERSPKIDRIDSIFPIKKVRIESTEPDKSIPVIVDGQPMLETPVTIEVAPQKLKVIVGKGRLF